MQYNYDEKSGRLISQLGDKGRYEYFYDKEGRLSRITLLLLIDKKWTLTEEIILDYIKPQGGQQLIIYSMNKLRTEGPRKNLLDRYCIIGFFLDEGNNNIIKSRIDTYNYRHLAKPLETTFQYDDKPNPLQQIFIERWYEFDMQNKGLTNLISKKNGDKVVYNRVYEYDKYGYPLKCIINNTRTNIFKYEQIAVVPQITTEPLSVAAKGSAILLFPNPASTEVTIRAEGMGIGPAQLSITDLNGRILRRVAYTVNNNLEALVSLAGIPSGIYIVELVSPGLKERKKLIIQ